MVKKTSVLVFAMAFTMAFPALSDIIHKVAPKETVWFISKLYYGDGKKFNEILFANQKKTAKDIIVGEELVVPLPKFSNKSPDFQQRYDHLVKEREGIIGKKKVAAGQPTSEALKHPVDLSNQSLKRVADEELKSK